MLKLICLKVMRLVFLTVIIILVTVNFNLNSALAQEKNSSPNRSDNVEQTSPQNKDEKTTQRQATSQKEDKDRSASQTDPSKSYNREAIEHYDDEVYGN